MPKMVWSRERNIDRVLGIVWLRELYLDTRRPD